MSSGVPAGIPPCRGLAFSVALVRRACPCPLPAGTNGGLWYRGRMLTSAIADGVTVALVLWLLAQALRVQRQMDRLAERVDHLSEQVDRMALAVRAVSGALRTGGGQGHAKTL